MKVDHHAVFNSFQAREYWKEFKQRWIEAAEHVTNLVREIESPVLRDTVAFMIASIAKKQGSFLLEFAPGGFVISGVELDDELVDTTLRIAGGDQARVDEAFQWIVALVGNLPATFVAWAFGPLKMRDPAAKVGGFVFDRFAYDLESRRLIGVTSHPSYGGMQHPKNKVIEIDFD